MMKEQRELNNPNSWRSASKDWKDAITEFKCADVTFCTFYSELCLDIANKLETDVKFEPTQYLRKMTSKLYPHKENIFVRLWNNLTLRKG